MDRATLSHVEAYPLRGPERGTVVRAELLLPSEAAARARVTATTGDAGDAFFPELPAKTLRCEAAEGGERRVISARLPEGRRSLCLRLTTEGRRNEASVQTLTVGRDDIKAALARTAETSLHAQEAPHHAWMLAHAATADELARQRAESATWTERDRPLVSIVTPVFRPPVAYLEAMVDSVLAQSYERWELVLANASGDCPQLTELLASIDDARVRVVTIENRSISENTNRALEEARGDYVAFVDHDDLIEPDALYRYVCALHEHPEADLLFCDEDLCSEDERGELRYFGPRFKPGWNHDLALTHNYVCHMLVVSRRALELTERSGTEVNAAQDYDLTFKAAEVAREICHVPRLLYHWREHEASTATNRDSKPYALEAGRLAVQAHLDRTGVAARVGLGAHPFSYRVEYRLPEPALGVSIVLLDTGRGNLARALDSVRGRTEYPWDRYELVVVTDASRTQRVTRLVHERRDALRHGTDEIRVVATPDGASENERVSRGMDAATHGRAVILDDWCEAVEGNWLTELIEPLQREDVLVSSPLLLDGDGLVQTLGLTLRPDGSLGRVGPGLEITDYGYMSQMFHARDCDVVPLAGMALGRDTWRRLAPRTSEDAATELCLRVREAGGTIVTEPYGPLALWRDVLSPAQRAANPSLLERHSAFSGGGSFQNPALDPWSEHFGLSD